MSQAIVQDIRKVLQNVAYQDSNILDAGRVESITVEDGHAMFLLHGDAKAQDIWETLRAQCEAAVMQVKGISRVSAILTAEYHEKPQQNPNVPTPPRPKPLPGVRHIIAVGSGKGGVGKSTIAAGLAVALAQTGKRVGLVDADIHGPSLTRLMGVHGKPSLSKEERLIPPEAHGVNVMSMGLLMDNDDTPIVWRGPMISKGLQQLMRGTEWGELDILVMDLPPGTGDIHLSIVQNFILSGVVIVTTPQEIALMDVRKAITMLEKVGVPILGLVENMSYLQHTSGVHIPVFGQGGTKKLATEKGLPILATLPLDPEVAHHCDHGIPPADMLTEAAILISSQLR
ncbi:MAG: Mrp/NBP35 family ATP-binding protein [Rickettsiales bacterium]|nr:Mrp/NBP35 family ATP-binding protein [Rickettsiales bacterium]